MCWLRVRLMWSIIAASVVVLPEPVAPVTRTRPRCSLGEPRDAGRQAELSKLGTSLRDHAERERDRAALAEAVDAEAGQALGRVGDVEVAALVELAQPLRGDVRHGLERGSRLLVERRPLGQRRDRAVRAASAAGRLQVDVARAEFDRAPEEGIQVHGASLRNRQVSIPL